MQAALFAVLAAEEAVGEQLAAEVPDEASARAADLLLSILSAAAQLHGALEAGRPQQRRYALGLALLEPLCQLISPLLACLQGRPSMAQVCAPRSALHLGYIV